MSDKIDRDKLYKRVSEVAAKYALLPDSDRFVELMISNSIEDARYRHTFSDWEGGTVYSIIATFYEIARAKTPVDSRVRQLLFSDKELQRMHNIASPSDMEELAHNFSEQLDNVGGDVGEVISTFRMAIWITGNIGDICSKNAAYIATLLAFLSFTDSLDWQAFEDVYEDAKGLYADAIRNIDDTILDDVDGLKEELTVTYDALETREEKIATFGLFVCALQALINTGVLDIEFAERFFMQVKEYMDSEFAKTNVLQRAMIAGVVKQSHSTFKSMHLDEEEDDDS